MEINSSSTYRRELLTALIRACQFSVAMMNPCLIYTGYPLTFSNDVTLQRFDQLQSILQRKNLFAESSEHE